MKDISARTVTRSELQNFNIYNLASENPRWGGGETVGVCVVFFFFFNKTLGWDKEF